MTYEEIDLVFDHLFARYPWIESFAFKRTARHLQFLDSEFCKDVLEDLMDQGIVALPIHDSILVPKRAEAQTLEVMNRRFKERFGQAAFPVKRDLTRLDTYDYEGEFSDDDFSDDDLETA